MKRIFTMLIVVAMIFSLVGCGNGSTSAPKGPEGTSGSETIVEETQQNPTAPETENHQDDSGVAKKYDNPGDDPRMIAQVNWKSGYYAFIDQYNLIGYSYGDTQGKNGARYYLDENHDYIPEAKTYASYFTPATGETGYKISEGKAFVDLENWAKSFDIDISQMDKDDTSFFCIETNSGKSLSISRDIFLYKVPGEAGDMMQWRFNTHYDGEPLYASAFGEKTQISNDFGVLWIIEQGFKALENDYAGNPW